MWICSTGSRRSIFTSRPSAIAQHVADRHDAAAFLGEPQDVRTLRPGLRDRLLQQHVIAHLQGCHRRPVVQTVGCRDNDRVGEFRDIKDVLPGSELVGGIDLVLCRVSREPDRNRLGHAHDVEFCREFQRVPAIHIAPVAGPGNDRGDRLSRLTAQPMRGELGGSGENLSERSRAQDGSSAGRTDSLQPGAPRERVFHGGSMVSVGTGTAPNITPGKETINPSGRHFCGRPEGSVQETD
jgi:hypothetical protein